MIKIVLTLTLLFFSGCVGKRGISLQIYNDCKEYYDLQGYYHKDCDDSNMITYKEINKALDDDETKKPKGNVW